MYWKPYVSPNDRRLQQERQQRQGFYDTSEGQVIVSKSLTKFLRHEIPKKYLQERLQELKDKKEPRPLVAVIYVEPKEFQQWTLLSPPPTNDQIFNVIANSRTESGQHRFEWHWTKEKDIWVMGMSDHRLYPYIMEDAFKEIWEKIHQSELAKKQT